MAFHPVLAFAIAVPGSIFVGITRNILAGARTDMYEVLPLPVAVNVSTTPNLSFPAVATSSSISATEFVVLPSINTATGSAIFFTDEYPTCTHFSDNSVPTASVASEPPTRVIVGTSPEPSKTPPTAPLTWRDFPLLAFGLWMSTTTAILTMPGVLLRFIVSLVINAAQLGADDVVVAIFIGRLTVYTRRFLRDAAEFDRWNGRHNNSTANANPDIENEGVEVFPENAATQTDSLPSNFQGCNEACPVRHDQLRAEAIKWVSEQGAKTAAVSRENSQLKAAAIKYESDVLELNDEYDELSEARTNLFNAEKAARAERDEFKKQLKLTRMELKRAKAKISGYETQIEKLKEWNKQWREQLDAKKQECDELREINRDLDEVLVKYDEILRKKGSPARTLEGVEARPDSSV
jgi:hypothetical protein